jgi:hypothetical protein
MAKAAVRRTVIRQWMSLPREKRQSRQQAADFAMTAAQSHKLPRSRWAPDAIVMAWLLPRTGKP